MIALLISWYANNSKPSFEEENIVKIKAEKIATEAVKAIKGFGIFGIEMFIENGKEILVN